MDNTLNCAVRERTARPLVRARILSTGPVEQPALDILAPFGEIIVAEDTDESTLISLLPGTIALVVRGTSKVSDRLIRSARDLRVIGRTGVGYESVDIAAASSCGIPVVYTPGAGARAVGEAAIAYMLALSKRLMHWDGQVKNGNWESRNGERPGDLYESVLGIIGFGAIGQMLAGMVQSFGMRVLAYDPYASSARAQELQVELVDLSTLLSLADFICLHAPLNRETRNLIDRDRLSETKRGAILVNLARGGVVASLDVIYEALVSGQLGGRRTNEFTPTAGTPREDPGSSCTRTRH